MQLVPTRDVHKHRPMLRRLHREEHQLLLLGIQVLTILLLRQVVVWRVCRVEGVESVGRKIVRHSLDEKPSGILAFWTISPSNSSNNP